MLLLSSPAFEQDGAIPRKYTGEGEDVSPPLQWTGVPPDACELALICDDPDAPMAEPFVHWVVYGIPADMSGLAQGSAGGAREGRTSFGGNGYGGPMPPPGHGTHHYHFRLYALDAGPDLKPGASKDELIKAMKGHVLEQAELVGTYER